MNSTIASLGDYGKLPLSTKLLKVITRTGAKSQSSLYIGKKSHHQDQEHCFAHVFNWFSYFMFCNFLIFLQWLWKWQVCLRKHISIFDQKVSVCFRQMRSFEFFDTTCKICWVFQSLFSYFNSLFSLQSVYFILPPTNPVKISTDLRVPSCTFRFKPLTFVCFMSTQMT